MAMIEDLFDKRSVVGIRLEQIIIERGCTKTDLCKGAGVSRPTLDKLLAGTLTSKTNYEKHVAKVLECLEITPDVLLGNVKNEYSRTREIKKIMRISSEEIAEATGISLEHLEEIESGGEATLAELRDIAMYLSVSVNCLLGKNFFEPQIAQWDLFLEPGEVQKSGKFSGFWGHIGVCLCSTDKVNWYPITRSVRKMVYQEMDNDRIVVPCMNNKVLLLNMQNVKELILLDDDCDPPSYLEWDYHVDSGELPLVMYEALEDYVFDDIDESAISKRMRLCLQNFLEKKGWAEDDVREKTDYSYIYYADGKMRPINIDFYQNETITAEVESIYLYEDSEFAENILYCEDTGGAKTILNMRQIAMLELPLLHVENKICEEWEQEYE